MREVAAGRRDRLKHSCSKAVGRRITLTRIIHQMQGAGPLALTLESSRHIPCAVPRNLRTAHGMCLLLCGQSQCQWALAHGFHKHRTLARSG